MTVSTDTNLWTQARCYEYLADGIPALREGFEADNYTLETLIIALEEEGWAICRSMHHLSGAVWEVYDRSGRYATHKNHNGELLGLSRALCAAIAKSRR